MIEVAECALVDKPVVQRLREETEDKLKTGDPIVMAEAVGAKRTLEKLDLWEDPPIQKEMP